jgi:hypothetical protein
MRAQRRSAGDQIADEIRFAQARRDLDGSREFDNRCRNAVTAQIVADDAWVARCNPFAIERLRPIEARAFWYTKRQATVAVVECVHLAKKLGFPFLLEIEPGFFGDVAADDAKIADVFLD